MEWYFFLNLIFFLFTTNSSLVKRYTNNPPSINQSSEPLRQRFGGEDVYSTKNQIRFNSPDLILNHTHLITNQSRTRDYTLVITNQTAAPDGYLRTMLVINGQYPGPLIEANEGDTLNILVVNRMKRPISIHWHGIHQNGNPWMDGVTGVTQCPIQPDSSFLYTFKLDGQFGTFWYHAHTQNLKSDGIVGPLIIHSPRDPLIRGRDFDEDRVVFVSDWYHDTSTLILSQMLSPSGYNGSFAAPSPNSVLLNGVGYFDCNRFAPENRCQTNTQPLELNVRPNSRTRFRFIHSGSRVLFRLSFDRHPLEIIEADATPVKSHQKNIQRVQIHTGERYSIVLDTSGDKEGDSFFLRAALDTDCLSWLAPEMTTTEGNTAKAIIRVTEKITYNNYRLSEAPLPMDSDWPVGSVGTCFDANSTNLIPRIEPPSMDDVKGRVFFNTSFGSIVTSAHSTASERRVLGRFFVDNTTYISRPQAPLLQHMLRGGQGHLNSSEVASETIDKLGFWDIVVNNLDANLEHPFHLHGMDTCLVSRGAGVLNEESAKKIQYNTRDSLCRDVHVLPAGTYSVFRVFANNPGVWFFHCHMGWHLASGFAGVIIMHAEFLRKIKLPSDNQALCEL